MTTNQILTGVGLIFALAAGSQVLASRLRIPAIIVLLPVGFVAGALTPDVDPQRLLGPAFEPLAAATGRGARLEGITAVLLLTDEDDFNALASVLLADTVGERVYRLAPPQRSHGVVAPYTTGEILFANSMTRPAVSERYADGARIIAHGADCALPAGADLLFVVRADGQLVAVTQTGTPTPQPGDTLVSLGPALAAQPADLGRSELPEAERR